MLCVYCKFANGAVTGAYGMLFNELMHPKDPPKKNENIRIHGLMLSLTIAGSGGGTLSYGEFMYKGKSYGFVTYGFAFGIDGGICLSPFCITAPQNFDPLNDFSGKSSSHNISITLGIGITGSRGSSVSYNPESNMFEANNKVVTISLGPNYGLKAGYSYCRTETSIWEIPAHVYENDYNQFIR